MGLFSKKSCSICGGEIGLFGNRKLDDGNMCKNCAAKLSPWFSDRRKSTVAEIEEQLQYREANKEAIAAFNPTRTFGANMKLIIDEDAKKFVVTRERDLVKANPDVIAFSQVTGCDLDIDENRSEEKRKDREGNLVSYNPPRYTYSYDFDMVIRVNTPYFDTIRFSLNPSSVEINPDNPVTADRAPDPRTNVDYCEFEAMGREIKAALTEVRNIGREDAAPKGPVKCPACGAQTVPTASGCCEYCGSALQ
ncbi:MAG: DUF4428 domain-containing protein [Clostridia bacterium]|nr:DUF4428 domain-containing protein [Clostridia bacterium]